MGTRVGCGKRVEEDVGASGCSTEMGNGLVLVLEGVVWCWYWKGVVCNRFGN